jgi:hypothetical protein
MNDSVSPQLLDLMTYELIWFFQSKPFDWNFLRSSMISHLVKKYPQCFSGRSSKEEIFLKILNNGEKHGWLGPWTRQTKKGPKSAYSHPVKVKNKNNQLIPITVFKLEIKVNHEDKKFTWCVLPSIYRSHNIGVADIAKWIKSCPDKIDFVQELFGMSVRHWFKIKKKLIDNFGIVFVDKRKKKLTVVEKIVALPPTNSGGYNEFENLTVLVGNILTRLIHLEEDNRKRKEKIQSDILDKIDMKRFD